MKGLILKVGLATLLCLPISALTQDTTADTVPTVTYSFRTVNFPGDTFTQLLGINDSNAIAGYHGSGATGHPNQGFRLTLPNTFTSENVPGSVQTQVIGINNIGTTAGFYINSGGANQGFVRGTGGIFKTVDFPGTGQSKPPVNQLLGLNNTNTYAGYYADATGNFHGYIYALNGGVFLVFTIPGATSAQATGVNDAGQICGFFVAGGVTQGFVLNGGTFTKLKAPGATSTSAFGLNKNGQVVGTYTDTSGGVHGFVYKGGSFQSVDDPSGIGATIINGINDKGVIVGFYGSCTTGGTTCDGFVGTP